MGEQGNKSFFKSVAFKLIVVWIVMGVALSVAVKVAAPKMEHACEVWAEAEKIEVAATGGHGGGHGGACQAIADTVGSPHRNLAATMLPLLHGMDLAWAWNIPNFLILFTLLFHFAKEPLANNLKARRKELETMIAEAEQARSEAEAKLAEYERKMGNLEKEIDGIRADIRAQAEAEKTKLVAEAGKQAERIKNEADFTARQELLMAQHRLREDAARIAVEVAEEVIRQVINEEDRERLLDEYLQKIREQV